MTVYALRLINSQDTALRVRAGDTLGLAGAGPLQARGGLRPDGGGEVSVVEGSMLVQVSPFQAWVDGTASGGQGGYVFTSDSTESLTIEDGHAFTARVDTVAALVYDNDQDGSGETKAELVVVTGIPGAGAPALPTSGERLWDVNVPAGSSAGTGGLASSNLGTERRRYTAALGGVLPVKGLVERNGLTPTVGQPILRRDTGYVELYDGDQWRRQLHEGADVESLSVGGRVHDSLPLIDAGTGVNDPNGSGEFNIPHNLGVIPDGFTITSRNNGQLRHFTIIDMTATNVRVRVKDFDNSNTTAGGIGYSYTAVKL